MFFFFFVLFSNNILLDFQIVNGATATESGIATIPLLGGIVVFSIASVSS